MKTPHWPVPLGYKPIDLGLERVREFLNRLGNPEEKLPPVVHFAGTNGKGSTMAFLRAMLEAAGYKVHSYTSPHLVHFNERISIAGSPMSDGDITNTMEECRQVAEGIKVTFFEGTTVGALLAFSRTPADIVLLETGMGGRLDATNVIDNPELTVLTPISMDHMSYLGDTIAKIAFEKAAIMKTGAPCVVSEQPEEALEVIKKVAKEKNVELFNFNDDFPLTSLALEGEHQLINAATAVASAKNLRSFEISNDNIKEGLSSAKWPGRLQKLSYGPLVKMLKDDSEIWIDGGHNAAAGEILAKQCHKWQQQDDKPIYIISGMSQGKDPAEFFSPLKDYVSACYVIALPEELLRISISEMAEGASRAGMKTIKSDSYEEAVYDIISSAGKPVRILICGSLYLAGTILAENG